MSPVANMLNAFRTILDPSNLLQSCIQDLNKVDSKYTRFKNILSCSNVDLGKWSFMLCARMTWIVVDFHE